MGGVPVVGTVEGGLRGEYDSAHPQGAEIGAKIEVRCWVARPGGARSGPCRQRRVRHERCDSRSRRAVTAVWMSNPVNPTPQARAAVDPPHFQRLSQQTRSWRPRRRYVEGTDPARFIDADDIVVGAAEPEFAEPEFMVGGAAFRLRMAQVQPPMERPVILAGSNSGASVNPGTRPAQSARDRSDSLGRPSCRPVNRIDEVGWWRPMPCGTGFPL